MINHEFIIYIYIDQSLSVSIIENYDLTFVLTGNQLTYVHDGEPGHIALIIQYRGRLLFVFRQIMILIRYLHENHCR